MGAGKSVRNYLFLPAGGGSACGLRTRIRSRKLPLAPQPRVAIEPRAAKPVPGAEAPASDRRSNIRVDSTLVQINVTVTEPLNRFVTGLEKDHFRFFEDKSEQKLAASLPRTPRFRWDWSSTPAAVWGRSSANPARPVPGFFKTANPQDEFFLVQFNDRPELVQDFTTSLEEIQNRLAFTQAKGRTALLDGCIWRCTR